MDGSSESKRRLSVRLSPTGVVAELGQRALLSADVESLLQLAVDLLRETLGVEYAKVLHQPGAGEPLVLIAGSGWRDDVQLGETTVPCDEGSQAGYTLLSNEPVYVDDLEFETRFSGPALLVDHGVISGMSVTIQGRERPYGVLGVHSSRHRQFTPDDGDFLRSVANILGGAFENRRAIEEAERSARYEAALAECAQALLASSGGARIQHALETLFAATQATYVFLERNVNDPHMGFSSRMVADAGESQNESGVWDAYWGLVPWAQMPTSREHLEQGRPFVVIPEELVGPEYDLYAADPHPIKSELDVPIFVDGEWAGLIGFADQSVRRVWSETDVSLLTTVAKMMGAFWEREAHQEHLVGLNRAKDAFLASISHELRTPLTAMVGFSQILKDSADVMSPQERDELLELLVREGTDVTNMISDLLVAAKADIHALEVASVPLDLHVQASQVLQSLDREHVPQIKLLGDSVHAIGDPERVRQVIRNLVSNALRYGGETIQVEVRADATTASVLVRDNGDAIPEEDRERIFMPYQRAHNAPGLAGSLGLGLAISRQLADLMAGDLTYRYDDGHNVFELALPAGT